MGIRTSAFVLALSFGLAAQAQYIPPHSNDPHPPANQPSYQLPQSPFARPGVPGYPNAPHSNDPYYSRTEARPAWPKPPAAPSGRFPSVSTDSLQPPLTGSTPRARAKPSSKQPKDKTISLQQCYRNWDQSTRMSRADWESTCRRLSAEGRLAIF